METVLPFRFGKESLSNHIDSDYRQHSGDKAMSFSA